jgi:hypothetical protein
MVLCVLKLIAKEPNSYDGSCVRRLWRDPAARQSPEQGHCDLSAGSWKLQVRLWAVWQSFEHEFMYTSLFCGSVTCHNMNYLPLFLSFLKPLHCSHCPWLGKGQTSSMVPHEIDNHSTGT